MEKGIAIVLGSFVTLAVLTAPVLAKNTRGQKAEEKPASSSCHSYVQNPDGSWAPVPCQEIGTPTQAQQKAAGHGDDEAPR